MFVTYCPEDGDEQRWTFDSKRVRASKAEMIEKRFGDNWEKWLFAVQSGNMRARRVLLWHLLTLEHHGLRLEDVPDFYSGELLVEHSVAELREIRDRVAKSNVSAEQREDVFTALDTEITAAMEREEHFGEPEGKAPSKSGAADIP
ncbi:hypothetical protein [Sphaerimonospora thailandensis]|uniref:Uncharacterized protein n=1 Tax=Sphaerimonospora thailandensis TaxID=795644 RepID=A0A8J3VXZ7_9ACTN|nr:hypothetical protein [Sphaerimonospora thailandensis]GIH69439.1 hypothetical protein Mth01_16920 [Sphaerimonospora thailandensis]